MRKLLSRDEINQMNKLYKGGSTDREISEIINRPKPTISAWRQRNNLKANGLGLGVNKICKYCGKTFRVGQARVKEGKGIYCSRDCYFEAIREKRKEKKQKFCLNCNTIFLSHRKGQKFCSRSCATSYQIRKEKAEGKPAHSWKGGKIKKICIGCNKVFYVWPFKVKEGYGLFCNRECYQEHWRKYVGFMAPPTKPEKQFMALCEKYNMPFKYVGDNQFFIGRKNPDFVHKGGQKVCVEIFGCYYHSSLYGRKVPPIRTYAGTKKHYEKYGWECIVIWDNEVNSEELVLSRLDL